MPPAASEKIWIEWSSKVFHEVQSLNNNLVNLTNKYESLQRSMDESNKRMQVINDLLTGNGTPERGLVVRVDRLEQAELEQLPIRVDRLEQSESRRTWLSRTSIIASLGSVSLIIAAIFSHKF
jgi:hypothetical protein